MIYAIYPFILVFSGDNEGHTGSSIVDWVTHNCTMRLGISFVTLRGPTLPDFIISLTPNHKINAYVC